jgi:hypothetical protein
MHAVYLSNENYLESVEYIHTNIILEVTLKSMASIEYHETHVQFNGPKHSLNIRRICLY